LINFIEPFIKFIKKQINRKILFFRIDNAKKFRSKAFQAVLRKRNIEWEELIPYAHYQMGVIERANRTIGSMIRVLLIDTQFPEYLWPELFDTVLYLKNRSPNKAVRDMIPYEALHNSKPNLSHLKIIGSALYSYNVEHESGPIRQQKLEPRARKLRLIGYGKGTNQYKA
jgi:hypothetical protein